MKCEECNRREGWKVDDPWENSFSPPNTMILCADCWIERKETWNDVMDTIVGSKGYTVGADPGHPEGDQTVACVVKIGVLHPADRPVLVAPVPVHVNPDWSTPPRGTSPPKCD